MRVYLASLAATLLSLAVIWLFLAYLAYPYSPLFFLAIAFY